MKRKLVPVVALLLLVACIVFFFKAGSILTIPLSTTKSADVIVILGGETGAGSIRGLELCALIQGGSRIRFNVQGSRLISS